MKLHIAIISNRNHNPLFVGSLYGLTQHLTRHGSNYGVEMHSVSIGSGHSCLSRGRQSSLDYALKNAYTHVLYIDDDMVFPPTIAQIMLARGVPAIAANARMKTTEKIKCVARNAQGGHINSKGKKGVEEVNWIGMGIFLVELANVRTIPAPHFEVLWNAEKKDYISEDHYFCNKLRDAGIAIHVDHDASQGVGHVGDYVYSLHSA